MPWNTITKFGYIGVAGHRRSAKVVDILHPAVVGSLNLKNAYAMKWSSLNAGSGRLLHYFEMSKKLYEQKRNMRMFILLQLVNKNKYFPDMRSWSK